MPKADPSPFQYPYPPQRPQYQHQRLGQTSPTDSTNAGTPHVQTYELGRYGNTSYVPKSGEEARILVRTPSPTPSEQRELKSGALDWKRLSNWRFWLRREWLWYYVALIIILVLTALITIFHKQIVNWLTPFTKWVHDLKYGWLVPIGILFVISFPPLFGHEIVAILCGLVWGLWIGFAIVSAGTLLGEIGNFYAFKYCCRARGEKMEKTNITYACLAKIVRDGGFKIALIARLSAIPGHFTTAVFAACGMNIFIFCIAAILSMPKQFITVYLGVILEPSSTGTTDTKSRIISDVVLAITFLITIAAMWYIYHLMGKVKPQVIYERRKARQGKLARAASTTHSASSHSSDELPLTLAVHAPSLHQSSEDDSYRQTHTDTGYLYAPQPRHKQRLPPPRAPDDVEYGYSYDHGPGRVSTDDVGWDMGATPMRHEGMGREVGGLGAAGYGYPGQSHPQAGESSETLTGRSSSETVTLDGSRPGATSHPRTGEEREFGRGMGHTVEATDASYRTAREGSEDDHDEFAYGGYMTPPRATTTHQRSQLQPPPPPQQPLHNPFDPPNSRPAGAGASSPPPPSYRTNLNG